MFCTLKYNILLTEKGNTSKNFKEYLISIFLNKNRNFYHSALLPCMQQPRAPKQRTQRPLEEFPFPNGFSRGEMPVGKKQKQGRLSL